MFTFYKKKLNCCLHKPAIGFKIQNNKDIIPFYLFYLKKKSSKTKQKSLPQKKNNNFNNRLWLLHFY